MQKKRFICIDHVLFRFYFYTDISLDTKPSGFHSECSDDAAFSADLSAFSDFFFGYCTALILYWNL